jgi:hypothetical protein
VDTRQDRVVLQRRTEMLHAGGNGEAHRRLIIRISQTRRGQRAQRPLDAEAARHPTCAES